MTAGGCGAVTAGEGQLQPPGLQTNSACHGLLTSLNTHQSSDISESGRVSPRSPRSPLSRQSQLTRPVLAVVRVVTPNFTESEEELKDSPEDGEGICDDSLLGELSTMNSSFSLSVDSNQLQPHQG